MLGYVIVVRFITIIASIIVIIMFSIIIIIMIMFSNLWLLYYC